MKKSLTILTIAILAIVAFTSCVSAAEVKVQPETTQKITKGDVVEVTVNTVPGQGIGFFMDYDKTNFKCVSESTDTMIVTVGPASRPDSVKVASFKLSGTMSSVTLKFEALNDIVVPAGEQNKVLSFDVVDLEVSEATQAEATEATGTLTVTATTPGSTEGEGTGSGNTGAGNGGSGSSESEVPVNKKGETITEIDNAGTPVFAGVIALIVIAGAVLVIKNRK